MKNGSSSTNSASGRNPSNVPRNTRRHIRRSIILDPVHPSDFRNFDLIYCCEQCSHFDSQNRMCTMGYPAQHTQKEQLELYNRTGKMAFCRFLEID